MVIDVGKKEEYIHTTLLEGNLVKCVMSFKNTPTTQPITSASKDYPEETIVSVLKVSYRESHSIFHNHKCFK